MKRFHRRDAEDAEEDSKTIKNQDIRKRKY